MAVALELTACIDSQGSKAASLLSSPFSFLYFTLPPFFSFFLPQEHSTAAPDRFYLNGLA